MKSIIATLAILLLVSSAANAQTPWDIEIIKPEEIGREPGFSYGSAPVKSPNYFQPGRVTVEQADGLMMKLRRT